MTIVVAISFPPLAEWVTSTLRDAEYLAVQVDNPADVQRFVFFVDIDAFVAWSADSTFSDLAGSSVPSVILSWSPFSAPPHTHVNLIAPLPITRPRLLAALSSILASDRPPACPCVAPSARSVSPSDWRIRRRGWSVSSRRPPTIIAPSN